MKQKDFLLIGVIGIISAILSFIISSTFLTPAEDRQQNVEVVQPISTEFTRPPAAYFNAESINPTQIIQIGEDPNQQPFGTQ